MQTSYPLGHIDVRQPQPKYKGVSSEHRRPTQELIDALFTAGAHTDDLLQVIYQEVSWRYCKAPYNDGGPNHHLASIVTAEVARSLPGYAGDFPLSPFNPKRGKLSHFVANKARTKHLNALRDMNTAKRRVAVLAQDLGAADERRDVLSHLSDQQQSRRRGLHEQERALVLGTSYRWPLAANVVTSAIPARTGWHYDSIVDAQN